MSGDAKGPIIESGVRGRVVSIHRSNGGVPKLPVDRATIRVTGVEGDRQRNRRFHGGPDRALCLYSAERLQALVAEAFAMACSSGWARR